jgi:hypothetical protein
VFGSLAKFTLLVDASRRNTSFALTRRLAFGGSVPHSLAVFVDQMISSTPSQVLWDFLPSLRLHRRYVALAAYSDVASLVVGGRPRRHPAVEPRRSPGQGAAGHRAPRAAGRRAHAAAGAAGRGHRGPGAPARPGLSPGRPPVPEPASERSRRGGGRGEGTGLGPSGRRHVRVHRLRPVPVASPVVPGVPPGEGAGAAGGGGARSRGGRGRPAVRRSLRRLLDELLADAGLDRSRWGW